MVDWKRLLLPSIEKVIALVLIFSSIYFSGALSFDGFSIGLPYTFYSGSYIKGDGGNIFSISYLLIDLIIWYLLLCFAFYPKFLKIKDENSTVSKLIKYISNFIINLIIFVILFFVFLVITDDILNIY